MILSEKMRETLLLIGFGVEALWGRFHSIDDPTLYVDMRSSNALIKRGLVFPYAKTRFGLLINALDLTEAEFERIRHEN